MTCHACTDTKWIKNLQEWWQPNVPLKIWQDCHLYLFFPNHSARQKPNQFKFSGNLWHSHLIKLINCTLLAMVIVNHACTWIDFCSTFIDSGIQALQDRQDKGQKYSYSFRKSTWVSVIMKYVAICIYNELLYMVM